MCSAVFLFQSAGSPFILSKGIESLFAQIKKLLLRQSNRLGAAYTREEKQGVGVFGIASREV